MLTIIQSIDHTDSSPIPVSHTNPSLHNHPNTHPPVTPPSCISHFMDYKLPDLAAHPDQPISLSDHPINQSTSISTRTRPLTRSLAQSNKDTQPACLAIQSKLPSKHNVINPTLHLHLRSRQYQHPRPHHHQTQNLNRPRKPRR